MLIRAGYHFAFDAAASTSLVLMLSVRPERFADLATPHRITNDRSVPSHDYRDAFGNICTRMTLPAGTSNLCCDFTITDTGLPDAQTPQARQHDIKDLPNDVLTYLLGSRYCETDMLSNIAWGMFGHIAPGWQRV